MERHDIGLGANVGSDVLSNCSPPLPSAIKQNICNISTIYSLHTLHPWLHVSDEDPSEEPGFLSQTFNTIEEILFSLT